MKVGATQPAQVVAEILAPMRCDGHNGSSAPSRKERHPTVCLAKPTIVTSGTFRGNHENLAGRERGKAPPQRIEIWLSPLDWHGATRVEQEAP
jgi:hypothetical protein